MLTLSQFVLLMEVIDLHNLTVKGLTQVVDLFLDVEDCGLQGLVDSVVNWVVFVREDLLLEEPDMTISDSQVVLVC